MSPLLRAHLDLVAPREKATRNLPQWSIDVPRCEHGVSLLDDCSPCDQRYSAEVANVGRARLSPWNAASQSLRDAAARIAALPGDTSICLMHLQEAAEALDDWYAPSELTQAEVRELERDDMLARHFPLIAALEAAVKGTR